MSNFLSRDAYAKPEALVSIDDMPPELLHRFLRKPDNDEELERNKQAMAFAISLLSEKEAQFLFFRYFQGHSHKTLKQTMHLGSTKTAMKMVKRVAKCLREYTFYYLESDLERDLALLEEELGLEGRQVAYYMFHRCSKHQIKRLMKSKGFKISQVRLKNMVSQIEVICLSDLRLHGFWDLVQSIGKVFQNEY